MKKLLILTALMLTVVGCKKAKQQEGAPEEVEQKTQYSSGELVYVDSEKFIVVEYLKEDNLYKLKKVGCRSKDCMYYILEGEMSKTENTYKHVK